jgi:RNA binding S1 domain protein
MTRKLKVGEMVEGRITFKRDDGRVNVSMRPTKEKALVSDGDIIMEYLLNRGGKMPYSDESSAMLIKDKFNISKAAFKRALGHLMKEKKIVQEDGWTLLTDIGRQWTPPVSEESQDKE